MQKIKKILAIIALIGAVLKMSGNTDYNTVLSYLFLTGGLFLLAVEIITNKESQKPWIRIVLLLIPALIVALAIQDLLTNTYSSAVVISLGMYYLLSEQYILFPKKS
ncbi:MAG TPA: hypothetical protein VFM90_01665 [Cyclobacteriaceae bacterium]|nr:hypothetical protein [Cyclobacteriaceae bacterium]